jgi:signal transduction histidine kinase
LPHLFAATDPIPIKSFPLVADFNYEASYSSGAKMDKSEEKLTRIQRQDHWIRVLILILLGTSGAVLVLVNFVHSDLQRLYQEHMSVYLLNFLLLALVAGSLLFMGYSALKERAVKKLQRDIVEQKIASQLVSRRLTDLRAVLELTSLINSEMLLSTFLDLIARKALEALNGDQSSLFLYDPHISKLRCVALKGGKDERVSKALVETGKGIAGWVLKHGKPLLLDEDLNESQFRDFVKKDKRITSSLCVPLMVRNQPRGVLNITLFEKKRKFTQSDLKLAYIFAGNAAIAIDKAGLYEKLKKQTKTLNNVISELKSTQGQSGERERMRALGNLASGMSHDFSNILTAILSKIRLLSAEMEEKTELRDYKQTLLKWVSTVEQLAGHGVETAKQIQKFAKTYQASSQRDFEELDINAIVLEAVGLTRPKWKDEAEVKGIRIEIETELGKVPDPVGDHSEIREVLTSMILNSIDALPEGGRIRIVTRMHDNKVEIKVIDNGLGMDEETQGRVFEPFFGTKREKADGIALSLAHGIISRHNGETTVESQPGKGATFTVTLPISVEKKRETKKEIEKIKSPAT